MRAVCLIIALRPQTPKHIRGAGLIILTLAKADGNEAQNMVTVQHWFRTSDLKITDPTRLPTALTRPVKRAELNQNALDDVVHIYFRAVFVLNKRSHQFYALLPF
jgi:N-acetylglutamate synthase-like GNAT family acetyltransferase